MRTAQIYQPPHLIDTAPLVARYNYLNEAILAFITAGHMLLVVRYRRVRETAPLGGDNSALCAKAG